MSRYGLPYRSTMDNPEITTLKYVAISIFKKNQQ